MDGIFILVHWCKQHMEHWFHLIPYSSYYFTMILPYLQNNIEFASFC